MAAGGSSANVHLGPGRLYYAPIGTAEPASASASLNAAFVAIGYTEDGTAVETAIQTVEVEVAEELEAVAIAQTKRSTKVNLQLAEMTVSRLALALGASASRADDTTSFEFPAASGVSGAMLIWDSEESQTSTTNRRWIFRQVYPTGTITIQRAAVGTKKATIPASFLCTVPTGYASGVKVFPGPSGRV